MLPIRVAGGPDIFGDGPHSDKKYRWRNGVWESRGNKRLQKRRARQRRTEQRKRNIAILDFETDPFDNKLCTPVYPFLAVVYSDQFPTIVLWNNDWKALVQELYEKLEALDEPFTIYAHNGGRFDYMFLMHLLDGRTKFKGRAVMSARFGKHELRDSLHIIPESLRNANRKIDFDYTKMERGVREAYRKEITDYCIEDCVATFEIVQSFVRRFGLPMTIGQAAMTELKKHYEFKRLRERDDEYLRSRWFFGGRVECFAPPAIYKEPLKLYDVNSMYPSVMAYQKHPIGDTFFINDQITAKTAFVQLSCQNDGALVSRLKDGELTTSVKEGEFYTTIHEYNMAQELGLISNVRLIKTIDFFEWTNFRDFVIPLYERRNEIKQILEANKNHPDKRALEQELKFVKYLLNNAYGKFAQNPRKFKEYWLTPPGERPPDNWLYMGVKQQAEKLEGNFTYDHERIEYAKWLRRIPSEEANGYWIWAIPNPEWRFNNVATAASITGAARAKLMHARFEATQAMYCDTDSLICASLGSAIEIDPSKLGAWKCETEITSFIMAGKKVYGYRTPDYDGRTLEYGGYRGEKIRAKGQQGVTWTDLEYIVSGGVVAKTMRAPTIGRDQSQHYMVRELRATGLRV